MSTPSANGTANCRVTYVNPVVALALGAAVLAEPITPTALAGLALILAGTWAGTRRPRRAFGASLERLGEERPGVRLG